MPSMITFCKLSDKLKNFFSSKLYTVVKIEELTTVSLASKSSVKYYDFYALD